MAIEFINKINTAWTAAKNAWFGVDKAPSYLNPVYYDLSTVTEQRILKYQLLWEYYKGNHKKSLNDNKYNITLNYAGKIVDKGVSYLFGKPVLLELNEFENTAMEETLANVFGSPEDMQQLFIDMAITGGVCGDFVIQIWIDENGIPHFDNINPSLVYPKSSSNNYKDIYEYEMRWIDGDKVYRNRHIRIEDGTWYSEVQRQEPNTNYWITDEELSYAWPYTFPCIIMGKNLPNPHSIFGKSDLEEADINDAINFVASNINKVATQFAHPIIWGKGFDAEKLDISEFNISTDDNANLSALEVGKNTATNTDFLNFLKSSIADITSVPEDNPDTLRIGASSGFALQVLHNALILKTGIKRTFYGAAIIEMCRRALSIAGYGDDNKVKLFWQDPLPVDKRMENESDRMDLELGIASMKTIRAKRGYNDTLEQERIAKEKPNSIS